MVVVLFPEVMDFDCFLSGCVMYFAFFLTFFVSLLATCKIMLIAEFYSYWKKIQTNITGAVSIK